MATSGWVHDTYVCVQMIKFYIPKRWPKSFVWQLRFIIFRSCRWWLRRSLGTRLLDLVVVAWNLEPGGGGGRARHHGGGPRGREADRAAGGATPPLRHAPGRQVSVTAEEDTNGVDVLGEDNPREVVLPLVQHLPLETQQVLLPSPYQQPDNFVVYPIVDLKEQIFTVDICRYLFLTYLPRTILRTVSPRSRPPTSGRCWRWPRTRRKCPRASWPRPRRRASRMRSSCPACRSWGHPCCRSNFWASPGMCGR